MRADPKHPLLVNLNALRLKFLMERKHGEAHGVSMALITAIRWLTGKPLEPTPSDFARLEDLDEE